MQRRTMQTTLAVTLLAGLVSSAPAQTPAPNTDQARQLAQRFAAALTAHDITAFAALFADDYRNHQASAAAPPRPGLTDKQSTVGFFQARLTGLPDLQVTIEALVAAEGMVAASFVYTGTHTAPFMSVPPTGRRLTFTACDIFRLQHGLIAEHWGMGDLAGVLAQLKA